MSEEALYIEFETESGEYWSTENWPALAETFSISTSDLPQWHSFFSGQSRAWEIIRRIYQVTAMMPPDPETLTPWTAAKVAKKLGITAALVQEEIAGAVKAWTGRSATKTASHGIAGLSEDEFQRLTNFTSGRGLEAEKVSALLAAHGFENLQGEQFRAEMALRIISLQRFLGSSHQRTQATEILRLEASMHANRLLIVHYQNQIARLVADDAVGIKSTEIQRFQDKVEALEDRISKAAKAYTEATEAIGANELDTVARKRIYIETVTHLTEQTALWKKGEDHWLADGTWTAEEIAWLSEPLDERKPNYRLDVALRNGALLEAENFWNPDYVPKNTTRLVCERLAAIMKRIGPLGGDDSAVLDTACEASDHEDDEDEEEISDAAADDLDNLAAIEPGDTLDAPSSFSRPAASGSGFKAF